MKFELRAFQETAVIQTRKNINKAMRNKKDEGDDSWILLNSPTGSGKTVMATEIMERVIQGCNSYPPNPDAIFLWISDLPEINTQTIEKMDSYSDEFSSKSNIIQIDGDFDEPVLSPGNLYVLNTQKLGKGTKLVSHGNHRENTIWEILSNTIDECPSDLIVIIDEAHRGAQKGKAFNDADTIIKKFLLGSPGEMPLSPIVVGITATPDHFEKLMEGTERDKHANTVPASEVRKSGLLKDELVFATSKTISKEKMLESATKDWQSSCKLWEKHCEENDISIVEPIMIIQVENSPDQGKTPSKTDLGECVATITSVLGKELPPSAYAHCFQESSTIKIDGNEIRHLPPNKIEADSDVKVVFCKEAISTGWDCPRAEILISYRSKDDPTAIKQLLGRIIRTPLARRIESESKLNEVVVYVPEFNRDEVSKLAEELQKDNMAFEAIKIAIDDSAEMVEYPLMSGTEKIVEAMMSLKKYTKPSKSKPNQLRRLRKLTMHLGVDKVDEDAHIKEFAAMVSHIHSEFEKQRKSDEFKEQVKESKVGTIVKHGVGYSSSTLTDSEDSVIFDNQQLNQNFEELGSQIGEGFHIELLKFSLKSEKGEKSKDEKTRELKDQLTVFLSDPNTRESIEKLALEKIEALRKKHAKDIKSLDSDAQKNYIKVAEMSDEPVQISLTMPDSIVVPKEDSGTNIKGHIYSDDNENLHIDLVSKSSWEKPSIEHATKGDKKWLRIKPHAEYSPSIPYKMHDGWRLMFPDFCVFDEVDGKTVIDIVDPHNAGLPESVAKAKALKKYAQENDKVRNASIIHKTNDGKLRELELVSLDDKVLEKVKTPDDLIALYKKSGTIIQS